MTTVNNTSWQRNSVLGLSSFAFTLLFAVWLMFGVLGIPIRKEFGLSDEQFAWLSAVAILNGSLWRLLFGIWADRIGGKRLILAILACSAGASYLVSTASSYHQLLLFSFLVGIAGNAFSVGVAWNSAWFPPQHKGFALGIFGAGNVGASVTKFIGPALIALVPAAGLMGGLIPGGWRFVPVLYSALLILTFFAVLFLTPRQEIIPSANRPILDMFKPLKEIRVWRFSLYYVVVFGAYVALSVWLPKYYVDVFGLELKNAALLTALFIFPASLLRPLGGWLSDKFGPRRMMYWVFGLMCCLLLALSMPEGHISILVPSESGPVRTLEFLPWHMNTTLFTFLIFGVGACMGIGKAAVFKYIPEYYPKDVGAVGGLVGMLGALGGFFLPPLFAYAKTLSHMPQSTFAVLFIICALSFVWLHWTVWHLINQEIPGFWHKHHESRQNP